MADSPCGILFDLDQTLVLTSKIEQLRRGRAWEEVYKSFGLTSLPPGTKEFVKTVKLWGATGVVTTGPRPYAERLLKWHQLPLPVVVAYHDVAKHKPDPEPLLEAARRMKVSPNRSIYVGDSVDDILAANSAGSRALVVDWDGSFTANAASELDFYICKDWDEVQLKAREFIDALPSSGRS
jgi:HAD superfamily hydrolase (TIGR01549 family)